MSERVEPGDGGGVLIVGAGPVGLVAACELARRRTCFRLIDALPEPTDESRAIIVHARSLEMLAALGAAEPLVAASIRTTGMELHSDGRTLASVEFTGLDTPFPFSAVLPQTATERVLTERLAELGHAPERGVRLTALSQDDAGVEVELEAGGSAGPERARFSYVIGADGARSAVRAAAGAKLAGDFHGERFLLADVQAEHPYAPEHIHAFSSPEGPFLLFSMPGGRARLMGQMAPGDDRTPELADVQAMADDRAGGVRVSDPHWLSSFEIHHGQVASYRIGRVFVAGDAAHIHSPAGGQGMNTGMQDAFNLAWKLDLTLRGHGSEDLLDSYDAERRPVAARVIRATTLLTRAMTVRSDRLRRLRDAVAGRVSRLRPVVARIGRTALELDIAYPEGLAVGDGGGAHAPDAGPLTLDGAVSSVHELTHSTRHVVLVIAGTDVAPRQCIEAAERIAAGLGELADVVAVVGVAEPAPDGVLVAHDPDRSVALRYEAAGQGALVLVRPDGYIGWRSDRLDPDGLLTEFRRLHGATG